MKLYALPWLLSVTFLSSVAPSQTTEPALWSRLQELSQRSQAVKDLTAHFEQEKFTPLLKKPMTSSGTVKVRGSAMLWDTKKPSPTAMRVDDKGVSLYYPQQKTMEVFPLDQQLGALAASPLPDLNVLSQYFSFEPMPTDAKNALAVRCKPINDAIARHVQSVNVVLDTETGLLRRMEMIDADGERTLITFNSLQSNTGLTDADVALNVPADTKIVRPLDNAPKP